MVLTCGSRSAAGGRLEPDARRHIWGPVRGADRDAHHIDPPAGENGCEAIKSSLSPHPRALWR
eukprot:2665383-Rhodomonas_salina.1